MRPHRNRRHGEFAWCEFACTSSTWRSWWSSSSEIASIGATDPGRQGPCLKQHHPLSSRTGHGKRRRSEESKIRRKSVTLRAAGPRVARSSEAMVRRNKHRIPPCGACFFGPLPRSHAGPPGRRPAAPTTSSWGSKSRASGIGNRTSDSCSFPGSLCIFRPVRFGSSDLRFFDAAVGSCSSTGTARPLP